VVWLGFRYTLCPRELSGFFFVYVNVQERKVAFLSFHCERYLFVESTEVVQKFCQLFLAVRPDNESVIYISEPAYTFVCRVFYCFLPKILHEEIHNYRRKWCAHCYPVRLFLIAVHLNGNIWMLVRV